MREFKKVRGELSECRVLEDRDGIGWLVLLNVVEMISKLRNDICLLDLVIEKLLVNLVVVNR